MVDDEPGLTDALVSALHYDGWQVQGATDGQAALAMAAELQPDLVILDVMLPDLDGYRGTAPAARGVPACLRAVPHRAGRGGGPGGRDQRRWR